MSTAPDPFKAKVLRVIESRSNAAEPADEWREGLILKKNGDPQPVHANVLHVLRNSPEFAGLLGWDEFKLQVIILRETPWGSKPGPWTENDDMLLTEWCQRKGILVRPDVVGAAVQTVAYERPRHVVRDYLAGLKWDGVPRIDHWLTRYLAVEETPIAGAFGSRWLLSAVARIMEPGSKVDTCLILEGRQGIGKSRALKVLASPEWFSDTPIDMNSKDGALQLSGKWLVEFAELDTLDRATSARTKAFMSSATDHFRPPYAKRAQDAKRQCVFAGTVNESEYLKDATGGRRFWPVRCGEEFDLAGLERDRDQLWAEAMVRYRAGGRWWLDDEEIIRAATEEQASRFDGDVWQELIEQWLIEKDRASTPDILGKCLQKPRKDWTHSDKIRIKRCMDALGWKKKQVRVNGQPTPMFLRPQ